MARIVEKYFPGTCQVRSDDVFTRCVFDVLKIENSNVKLRMCQGEELRVRLGSVYLEKCVFEKITVIDADAASFIDSSWTVARVMGKVPTKVTNKSAGEVLIRTRSNSAPISQSSRKR